jgi:hypothetical protein
MAAYGENSKSRRCRHPHHAARRGSGRQDVLLTDRDRKVVPQYVRRLRRALQPARVGFLPHDQPRSFRGGPGGRAKSGAGLRAHDAHPAISPDTRICYSWSTAVAHSLEHPLSGRLGLEEWRRHFTPGTAGKFFASACGKRRWWNGFGRRLDADVHWASQALAEQHRASARAGSAPTPQVARRGRSSGTRGNGVIWYCPRFSPVFPVFPGFPPVFPIRPGHRPPVTSTFLHFPLKTNALPPTTPFPHPTMEPA